MGVPAASYFSVTGLRKLTFPSAGTRPPHARDVHGVGAVDGDPVRHLVVGVGRVIAARPQQCARRRPS